MRRYLPVAIIILVLILALGGAALLMNSGPATTPPSTVSPPANSTPATSTRVNPPAQNVAPAEERPAHYRGPVDAPVRIEEFGDFQCPPCGQFHHVMSRAEREYAGRVRFSFRHFPIRTTHRHAALAARSAEAAGQQGKFWEMHDLLYDKQAEWKDAADATPIFIGYARTLGLDAERFTRDIVGTVAAQRVAQDEYLAQARGVSGTPTVFLNGRELPFETVMNYNSFKAVIDQVLGAGKR